MARCRDAFWAHVPEAGHPDHRGELAASQGARGARQWHAPGSPDQEDGTQEDPHARSGEYVSCKKKYVAEHNARFAREPASPQDYHRKSPAERELEQVFCLETERSISNDWVVRYENRYFQLERTSDYPPRQAKVTVCEWEDGRTEIRYKGKARAVSRDRGAAAPTGRDPFGG